MYKQKLPWGISQKTCGFHSQVINSKMFYYKDYSKLSASLRLMLALIRVIGETAMLVFIEMQLPVSMILNCLYRISSVD